MRADLIAREVFAVALGRGLGTSCSLRLDKKAFITLDCDDSARAKRAIQALEELFLHVPKVAMMRTSSRSYSPIPHA